MIKRPLLFVNYLLFSLAVALLVVVVVVLATPPRPVVAEVIEQSGSAEIEQVGTPEPKPLAYYLKEFQKRQLFQAGGKPAPSNQSVRSVVQGADIVAKLELVGVVFDDSDPVAIIRDPGSEFGNRYRVGEDILGLVVEQIRKNSVTLTDGQQQFELKL